MSRLKELPSKTSTDKANKKNFERWSATLSEQQRDRFEGTIHRFLTWLSSKDLLINQTSRSTVKTFLLDCFSKVNKANGHLAFYNFYAWAHAKGVVGENFMRIDEKLERVHNEAQATTRVSPLRVSEASVARSTTESNLETSVIVATIHRSTTAIIAAIERQTSALVAASRGPGPELIPDITPPARQVNVQSYLESLPEHERDAAEMAIDRFKTFVRVDLNRVDRGTLDAFFSMLVSNSSYRSFDATARHIENLYGGQGPMKDYVVTRPLGAAAES